MSTMGIVKQFEQFDKDEFTLDPATGIGFASLRGTGRLCGVAYQSWGRGDSIFNAEIDETLAGYGFEGDSITTLKGVPDIVVAIVIQHYAYQGNKVAQRNAMFFSGVGIRTAIQRELGYQLPKPPSEDKQLTASVKQLQAEVKNVKAELKTEKVAHQKLKSKTNEQIRQGFFARIEKAEWKPVEELRNKSIPKGKLKNRTLNCVVERLLDDYGWNQYHQETECGTIYLPDVEEARLHIRDIYDIVDSAVIPARV